MMLHHERTPAKHAGYRARFGLRVHQEEHAVSAWHIGEIGRRQPVKSRARLESSGVEVRQFVPDDALLRGVERIRHIPCAIVQGKYDLLCPPITAVALHAVWPESTLQIIEDAGHSAFEPGIRGALVEIMDARRTTPP